MDGERRLNIKYYKPDELTEAKENARLHGSLDVEQIAQSIRRFGFNDPIAIWGKDNIIVEGHGRLEAARKLGLQKVPCFRLDELSDKDRRRYMIMHNRSAELSEWDFKVLAEELEDIDLSDFDINMGLEDVGEEGFSDLFTLSDSETPLVRNINVPLAPEQYEILQSMSDYFSETYEEEDLHTFGNDHKKSNLIFEGVYLWAMQNNLL